MNETQAKIIILCDALPPYERFAEFIATKLDRNYDKVTAYIRSMRYHKWVKTTKRGSKVLVTGISPDILEKAKEVLAHVR